MTLLNEDLALFLLVVETGSFSAAARRRGLTPSSVARRVEALELRLGTKLLKRSTRRLSMTGAGQFMFERGRQLAAAGEALEEDLSTSTGVAGGLLKVSASIGFGRRHVAPLLGDFLVANPLIKIELNLDDAFVDLLEADIDVAVRVGRTPGSRLRSAILTPVRRIACAGPQYLGRKGSPANPAELADHDCIVVGPPTGRGDAWTFARGLRANPGRRLVVNTPEAAGAAAVGNAGIAHLPSWIVSDDIMSGRLVRVLNEFEPAPNINSVAQIVWPEGAPEKSEAFVAFMTARIGTWPETKA